jgi:hypothetical protein
MRRLQQERIMNHENYIKMICDKWLKLRDDFLDNAISEKRWRKADTLFHDIIWYWSEKYDKENKHKRAF